MKDDADIMGPLTDLPAEKVYTKHEIAALLLRKALQDFYDWCGKDYPGWPSVEIALKKADDAGIKEEENP